MVWGGWRAEPANTPIVEQARAAEAGLGGLSRMALMFDRRGRFAGGLA